MYAPFSDKVISRLETQAFIGVDSRSQHWCQAFQQGVEVERIASRVLAKEASDTG